MLVLSNQQQPAFPQNFLCYDQPMMGQAPQDGWRYAAPSARAEPPMKVCRYWAKDGRCPVRGCPYSATHTAENSPRYNKFIPQEEATHSRRTNALVIEEPTQNQMSVEHARRPNALTIEEPKARKRPHALPIGEPTRRTNGLHIQEPTVRPNALKIKEPSKTHAMRVQLWRLRILLWKHQWRVKHQDSAHLHHLFQDLDD